jgi:hypothetical protein
VSYNRIVAELASGAPDRLIVVYQALVSCIALLTRNPEPFKELVDVLFTVRGWMSEPEPEAAAGSAGGNDAAIAREDSVGSVGSVGKGGDAKGVTLPVVYADLVSQLVSVNCGFLVPALQTLVRSIVPTAAVAASPARESQPGAAVAGPPRRTVGFRILKQVLRLVPAGVPTLFRVLSEHFPHKRLGVEAHRVFVTHLLQIAEELPPLQDRIFAIIVERMIQIDVRERTRRHAPRVYPHDPVTCGGARRACAPSSRSR